MTKINYLKGDATKPQNAGIKFIIHICNNIGAWGAGFVLAISKRWIEPEEAYRNLEQSERQLGNVQVVQVEPDIYVVNMIAQDNIKFNTNVPPIRYDALKECLIKVNKAAIQYNATVHMPKIGTGLAGGDWNIIEKLIEENIPDIEKYVYIF